jgi:hypothetical protein
VAQFEERSEFERGSHRTVRRTNYSISTENVQTSRNTELQSDSLPKHFLNIFYNKQINRTNATHIIHYREPAPIIRLQILWCQTERLIALENVFIHCTSNGASLNSEDATTGK